ncbi:MAG: serine dehydratase subunit alpha family protein [Anaerolineales bacterium]|nr:serine dehydratase subunit alpha family protein [Anaerolineales bacterium]
MDPTTLRLILEQEIDRTIGCTDPGTISLAAAAARRALGCDPEDVQILVSPNLYKNAAAVGVPGTGQRGIPIAAAIGAVLDRVEDGLAILEALDSESLVQANQLLKEGRVSVRWEPMEENLFVRADLTADGSQACAIIQGDYSNLVEVSRDGMILESGDWIKPDSSQDPFADTCIEDLLQTTALIPDSELEFLLDSAGINRVSALQALEDGLPLAGALNRGNAARTAGSGVADWVQLLTGTAGEARMAGIRLPIMALAGSGNQGITSFLGILAAAEQIGSPREKTARALAYSAAVTVYIKSRMTRLGNICGCTAASSPAVAAGLVFLLDGSFEDMIHAMQTVIGTLAGILCDGAKESCAYKLSLGASFAVQAAYLSVEGTYIRAGAGILADTMDGTIQNLARLNDGLKDINHEIISKIA